MPKEVRETQLFILFSPATGLECTPYFQKSCKSSQIAVDAAEMAGVSFSLDNMPDDWLGTPRTCFSPHDSCCTFALTSLFLLLGTHLASIAISIEKNAWCRVLPNRIRKKMQFVFLD